MSHYDDCRPGYCPVCGAGPGNIKNGECNICNPTPFRLIPPMPRVKPPRPEVDPRIELLRAELAEADRRAGAAERRLAALLEERVKTQNWLRRAKEEAGYDQNTSFDVVWENALAALKAIKK